MPAMNDGSYALEIDNKLHYIAGDYYDFRSADKVCLLYYAARAFIRLDYKLSELWFSSFYKNKNGG